MTTTAAQKGPTPQTPENMAETLKLAYDIQQAMETLKEADSSGERDSSNEGENESGDVKYRISPKQGELTAKRWEAVGEEWVLSSEETAVTKEMPFVATHWKANPHGHNGMEFTFYSNRMEKDGDSSDARDVWQLSVDALDFDGLKVVEEREGEVVSEWLGHHAVFGARPAGL